MRFVRGCNVLGAAAARVPRRVWPSRCCRSERKEEYRRVSSSLRSVSLHIPESPSPPARPPRLHGAQSAGSRERSHNWACGYKGTDPGNCHHSDPSQPAEYAARYDTRSSASRSSFRGFRVFLVSKILGPGVIGKQRGNIRITEADAAKRVDSLLGRLSRVIDPENSDVFFGHDFQLLNSVRQHEGQNRRFASSMGESFT